MDPPIAFTDRCPCGDHGKVIPVGELGLSRKDIITQRVYFRGCMLDCDVENWTLHNNGHLLGFFALPLSMAFELLNITFEMTEAIQENNTVQLKKLAEKQEKLFHEKYLPMKYAAARVLEKEGFTKENIKYLTLWWHVITNTDIRPAPYVAVKPHEDLKNLLDTFTFYGKPAEDNMRADMFDPEYKFKVNMETQVNAVQLLQKTDTADQVEKPSGPNLAIEIPQEGVEEHEYLHADRTGMHEMACSADFPEPLKVVNLQIDVHRLANNYRAENYARERYPSMSSSLCSDNFDDIDEGDFLPLALTPRWWWS